MAALLGRALGVLTAGGRGGGGGGCFCSALRAAGNPAQGPRLSLGLALHLLLLLGDSRGSAAADWPSSRAWFGELRCDWRACSSAMRRRALVLGNVKSWPHARWGSFEWDPPTSEGGQAGVPFRVPAVFTAGLRIFPQPEKFDDVIIPTKNKLKFVSKVPNYKKARKWTKQLSDIRGPARGNTTFTNGKFGIVALGGGYLHWGHMEMMRLAINRKMDSKNMFARWRVRAPYKPLTRKGLGQRMGGGKGAIDHYVTPVKYGQLVVEVGGRAEFTEAEGWLVEVANKLPFPAKAVSSEQLEEMQKTEEWRMENNENPWTFKRIVDNNMLGLRFTLSPYDIRYFGRFWGKFKLPS